MAARSRAGRPGIVMIGASASTLKPYVLVPTTIGQYIRRGNTEYAAPLRIGPPDYDARLTASTLAIPDFAGGLGKYLVDSRQESNRSWASSVDTRFSGVISLLPKFTASSLTTQPTNSASGCWMTYSTVNSTSLLYMAIGDRLYSLSGTTWSDVCQLSGGADMTHKLRRILLNSSGTFTEYLVWCRSDGSWACSGDPTNPVNFSSFTPASAASDIYASPLSAELCVTIDTAGLVHTYAFGVIATAQVGAINGPGGFLGVMQNVLYMIDRAGSLWGYDPTRASGQQVYQISDVLPLIVHGVPFDNAQLALTDGRRVVLWAPSRPTRDATPGAPDGLPAAQVGTIRSLFTIGGRLLCYWSLTNTTEVQLLEYRGGGWHTLSVAKSGSWPGATSGNSLRLTSGGAIGFNPVSQRHVFVLTPSANTYTTYLNALPAGGEQPFTQELLTNGDGFESTGVVETGWHYLGLRGLSGPLLQVRLLGEMVDTNVSIAVKYRINFDEASGWTTLGTLTSTTRLLTFGSGAGVSFRQVRFQLTLAQTGGGGGGTSGDSPNASFSIDFIKVPTQLSGRVFTIDLAATARRSRRPQATVISDLFTLAEQETLPAVVVEDEGSTFLKLEAPRVSAYLGPDGKLHGALILGANEMT